MAKAILAIDQGTTGTTVLIFDKSGKLLGRAYSEFKQYYPKSGWVEHDAEEIWQVTSSVIQKAKTNAKIKDADIAAIGITNQRETTLIWDRKTGKPIHNAIVWQCRRTAPLCDDLKKEGLEPLFQERAGLVIDAYFSGTKIKWLLDNVPGARQRAETGELAFGTIDTWLMWKLTNGAQHVTDYTNASRTLVYNIHEKQWDDELLEVLNIPAPLLPEVKPSSGVFGVTQCDEFDGEIPIAGIAGDQQAASYGQLCWQPGMVKNTYGTGCFIIMNTGDEAIVSKNKLLTTLACDAEGGPCYALEGAVFIAGAVVQWLRDELGMLTDAAESEALAESVPNTNGVYLVPAFVGLGAPHWDANARGAVVGLTRNANRRHIVRAGLEAIAYQSADVVAAMQKDAGMPIKEMRVDGGASANNFLMQFQADMLNIPIERPALVETTAMGAAFLAGLAVDFWSSPQELEAIWQADKKFQPSMSSTERLRLQNGWQQAVRRVLR